MKRPAQHTKLLLSLAAFLLIAAPAFATTSISLYHNPGCMCCEHYADYLDKAGYTVEIINASDMAKFNHSHGVAPSLASCHTMLIGDYVVVGHVPAPLIDRLLREQPDIRGIALPAMPMGSPGMGGQKSGPFVIYSLNGNVFTRY